MSTTVRVLESVREAPREAWDALVAGGSPFLEWQWLAAHEEGHFILRYAINRLRLERTARLERLELALIRFTVARRMRPGAEPPAPALKVTSEDRALVFAAIAKLGDKLALPLGLDEKSVTASGEEYHPATTPGDS